MEHGKVPDGRAAPRQRRLAQLRAWTQAIGATAVVIGLYYVIPLRPQDLTGGQPTLRWPGLIVGLVVVTSLVRLQVKRALRPERQLGEQLAALLTLVAMVAAGFAAFYYRLAEQFNAIETRTDALYFSMATLSTVGYGDIVATGQSARALVTVQMAFDLIIVTSAVTIVVGSLRAAGGSARDR